MRKSIFKVLALLGISLILLFSLSFSKVDTEYMAVNSKGDYGKTAVGQRLNAQSIELEETDTILPEEKQLGVKSHKVAELKNSIFGKNGMEAKITELAELESKRSEEKPEVIVQKAETFEEEQEMKEPEVVDQEAETFEEEQEMKEPEVVNQEAGILEEEQEMEEPEVVDQKAEILEEEQERKEPEAVDQKTGISEEEPKMEEPEIVDQKTEISEEEPKMEEPEIVDQKTEISEEEPKMEEPEVVDQKTEILEEESKMEEPEIVDQKTEILEEEPKMEEPEVVDQKTEILEEEQKTDELYVAEQEAEATEPDTAILGEKEQEIQMSTEQLNTEEVDDNAVVKEEPIKSNEDSLTKIISNEGEKLTIEYMGPYWVVNFAIFKCDTTMCVGFEGNAKSRIIEGRRGGCTVDMLAPEALEGYRFIGWQKDQKEEVEGYSSKIDVYRAVYEKIEYSKDTKLLLKEKNVEEKKMTDSNTHKHVQYRPEDGYWTEMTSNSSDEEIVVHYKGCHCYVSFAEFICDTAMCEGFGNNGASEMMEGRRGECTVTVKAPKAREGYVFEGWSREDSKDGNINIYRATYRAIE